MVLLESVPHLRLRCIDEIEDHARIKAKRFVVVFRLPFAVPARSVFISFQGFDNEAFSSRVGVRPASQQCGLDDLLKISFRDVNHLNFEDFVNC